MREPKFKRDVFAEAELAKAGSANMDGKQRNFKQYVAYKNEMRDKTNEELLVEKTKERPGICKECGGGKFKQRMDHGDMIRICKNPRCGHEVVV